MAIIQQDFDLTPQQLQAINAYVQAQVRCYAEAGEALEFPEVNVRFSFTAVLGRSVSVSFENQPEHEISSFE